MLFNRPGLTSIIRAPIIASPSSGRVHCFARHLILKRHHWSNQTATNKNPYKDKTPKPPKGRALHYFNTKKIENLPFPSLCFIFSSLRAIENTTCSLKTAQRIHSCIGFLQRME